MHARHFTSSPPPPPPSPLPPTNFSAPTASGSQPRPQPQPQPQPLVDFCRPLRTQHLLLSSDSRSAAATAADAVIVHFTVLHAAGQYDAAPQRLVNCISFQQRDRSSRSSRGDSLSPTTICCQLQPPLQWRLPLSLCRSNICRSTDCSSGDCCGSGDFLQQQLDSSHAVEIYNNAIYKETKDTGKRQKQKPSGLLAIRAYSHQG